MISGAVASGRDITRLKHAELDQTLRANILESISVSSSLTDIVTDIVLLAERHNPELLCSIFLINDKNNELV